ncbi:hypothetical protein [Parasutterella excrementihominis]|uniref:hypothetical protein n=1 Tax=Parasutterella excrementihominis TaxID=487175 RepID=UPI003AAC304D
MINRRTFTLFSMCTAVHTSEDFEALLKGNKLLPHFTIFGTTDDKTPAVSKWLKGIGLLNK